MKKNILLVALLSIASLWGCNDDSLDAIITVDSNFETTPNGWDAEFSGYSSTADSTYLDTLAARARLPRGLDTTRYAFRVFARNTKENMFNYLKKKVTGFSPNGAYELVFDIDLGTNYPETSTNSPANAITLKAGASGTEPVTTLVNKIYTFNLDKGAGSQAGKDVVLTGSVASGRTDTRYGSVRHSNASQPFRITANSKGEIWFFVGTESSYKDSTIFYYDRIIATIKEQ